MLQPFAVVLQLPATLIDDSRGSVASNNRPIVRRHRLMRRGDANLDGLVNALDFNALATNFGGSGRFWFQGDFNYDGITNTLDFNSLAANFNQPALASPPLGNVVPEPFSIALMIVPLAMRRRRCGY